MVHNGRRGRYCYFHRDEQTKKTKTLVWNVTIFKRFGTDKRVEESPPVRVLLKVFTYTLKLAWLINVRDRPLDRYALLLD